MNLVPTLSLEQRALANIAITLWSQDDIRDLLSKFAVHTLYDNWLKIESVLRLKSFQLGLPELLMDELFCFIMRVGFQLISWIYLHCQIYRFVTQLPATFVWTSLGTIDNKETAKLLVMSGTLDGDTSFALACMYCLEDEIKYCWDAFNIFLSHKSVNPKSSFVLYWFNYMCELHRKETLLPYSPSLLIPQKSFLLESARSGNIAAIRYFFKVNRKNSAFVAAAVRAVTLKLYKLKNLFAYQQYSEVMLFLLSKINPGKQVYLIKNNTYALLKCFLLWPWNNLFLEMVKDNWNSLSERQYQALLYSMVILMHHEYNLHELFGEFWQHSPKDYRQFIADQNNIAFILTNLYRRGDEKNVKLILKDSNTLTRKNIFKIKNEEIFMYLVHVKKWDSIKFLIQECLSSQADLIRFRDVFKNHVHELLSGNGIWKEIYSDFKFKECQWDKFFQLVDGCILGYNTKKTYRIQ